MTARQFKPSETVDFVVTSGRGQPTMTIQALAFRAADHIGRFAMRNEI